MTVIRCEVNVRAPVERCFDLARSVDLHVDSSTEIGARAIGGRCAGLSGEGDFTVWSARFFGIRFPMTTQIEDFRFPSQFGDRMTNGLLRHFVHIYRFRSLADGTCAMSDELTVEAPFGLLGRLVERLYLERRMRHLVRCRLEKIREVAEGGEWQRYVTAWLNQDRRGDCANAGRDHGRLRASRRNGT